MLHNGEEGCLSTCPTGGSLESQFHVTTLDKGITIIFMLCLDLTSERSSESVSSSSLGIVTRIDIIHTEDYVVPSPSKIDNS